MCVRVEKNHAPIRPIEKTSGYSIDKRLNGNLGAFDANDDLES